jgi:beta-xylosidase
MTLVKPAKGAIDPCPFWDDDGRVYLVHAWAKSRAGFNSVLTVDRLSADGTRVEGAGGRVFDGHERHPTIEGPKLYKRGGYYYIFAPAGGVASGWQTVLRSRNVFGPYEDRIVVDQGKTSVNGPHQGAWVETPSGESWFLHFQDRGAYGRVVHLEPMEWKADWPVVGSDPDGDGRGEPVASYRKPSVSAAAPVAVPQASDAFDERVLGLQWQWNANPRSDAWSLSERPGFLRLHAADTPASAASLWDTSPLLLQKFPAEVFTATTLVDGGRLAGGERAGLVVMGRDYATLAVRHEAGGWHVVQALCKDADKGGAERVVTSAPLAVPRVALRATVSAGAIVRFGYSLDGQRFDPLGEPFAAREGAWVGARIGVFARRSPGPAQRGAADFDWFRIEP